MLLLTRKYGGTRCLRLSKPVHLTSTCRLHLLLLLLLLVVHEWLRSLAVVVGVQGLVMRHCSRLMNMERGLRVRLDGVGDNISFFFFDLVRVVLLIDVVATMMVLRNSG